MKVISLFSGAGGLDLGFIRAGHEVVYANDIDKDAVLTYQSNIGHHIVCENIVGVSVDHIPSGEIVIGGFPCQGFSVANTKRCTEDQRNQLYLELIRVIEDKQPYFFLLENVPGILSLEKGKVFEMILSDIQQIGYSVQWKLINSADYGVPQGRKRVIFFGVKNGIEYPLAFPETTHSENGTDNKPFWNTVRDTISDLPLDFCDDIPNHTGTLHKVKINGYLGNRPVDWDRPSPTILGRGGGTGGPVILPHPELHRRMTVREVARLQSFEDTFIFKGSISAQYRQIGNAVPPLLAYHLAKQFPLELTVSQELSM